MTIVTLKMVEEFLKDGIPRTYIEIADHFGVSYATIYRIVREGRLEGKTPIMHRSFSRSNRHYVFLKRYAAKLGAVWNTDEINKPITFSVLLKLKGKL